MIINHNMQALNAHRQMGTNATNAQKSMEKLSSGLRINRAGDDAAGLAISEKMRGQIRGLDQASRNAQDGISMIQTAEGALNETHSILQRMRELSVQSSNDTNTDADRAELQKEIEQLTQEIDRIGNTTEFNTKKLLQGNENSNSVGATLVEGKEPVDAVAAKEAIWNTGDLTALADGNKGTIEFNGITINISASDSGTGTKIGKIEGNTIDLVLDSTASTGDDTDAKQAAQIVKAFEEMQKLSDSPIKDFKFEVAAKGIKITGSEAMGATNNSKTINVQNVTIANGTNTAQLTQKGVDGVTGVDKTFELSFDKVPTEGSVITIGDKTVAFYDSSKDTFKDKADAKDKLDTENVIDISGKTATEIAAELGKIDFTKEDGTGASIKVVGDTVTITAQQAGTAGKDFEVKVSDAYEGKKSELVAGDAGNIDLQNKSFELQITVGSKTFNVDSKLLQKNFTALTTYGSDDQKAVIEALKNAKAADGTKLGDLVDISFDNTTGNQQLSLIAKEVGKEEIKVTLTGADAGDATTAFGIQAGVNEGTVKGKDAIQSQPKDFEVSFQVGANEGQNMSIKIGDMRAEALGVSTIDVSKKEGAESAITVVDKAMATVSSQRSNLGAVQNRLEHTINNLGTSSENLTAAESRIRDVDMAKEMMTMSKNNILNQAAQAMLAQANQAPQQVLQLLR